VGGVSIRKKKMTGNCIIACRAWSRVSVVFFFFFFWMHTPSTNKTNKCVPYHLITCTSKHKYHGINLYFSWFVYALYEYAMMFEYYVTDRWIQNPPNISTNKKVCYMKNWMIYPHQSRIQGLYLTFSGCSPWSRQIFRGLLWYLPDSICNLCDEILNLWLIFLLWSKLSIKVE
jgi:hypothetical protein